MHAVDGGGADVRVTEYLKKISPEVVGVKVVYLVSLW